MKNLEHFLQRLISLESHIAHQDIIIQDLNEIALQQWKKIDSLENEMSLLKAQMDILSTDISSTSNSDTRPPHY
jgi:SlyX protein